MNTGAGCEEWAGSPFCLDVVLWTGAFKDQSPVLRLLELEDSYIPAESAECLILGLELPAATRSLAPHSYRCDLAMIPPFKDQSPVYVSWSWKTATYLFVLGLPDSRPGPAGCDEVADTPFVLV